MTQELEKQIVAWIAHELQGYRKECGDDYRMYITEDAVGRFVGYSASEDEQAEVGALCQKILNGDYGE